MGGCTHSKPATVAVLSVPSSPQRTKTIQITRREDEQKEEMNKEPASHTTKTAGTDLKTTATQQPAPTISVDKAEEEKVADGASNGSDTPTNNEDINNATRSSVSANAGKKGHHHHHHHHHRHSSVSSQPNAEGLERGSVSLIPIDKQGAPQPTHQRRMSEQHGSGHHRSRSRNASISVVGDGGLLAGKRGSTISTLLDDGADPKQQMLANQLKSRMMVSHSPAEEVQRKSSASNLGKDTAQRTATASVTADNTPEADSGSSGKHEKKKKKEKLIKTLELADLQHLSNDNLEMLWKQYDKDKNGTLDRKELKRLAKDCIGRTIAMCEAEIREQQPKLSESELKAAVEKELIFVLPGASKQNGKKEDVQKEMVRRLIKKLDVNGDGDVTKAELLATWNVFAKELFQMKAAEGPVGCSVM